MRRRPLLAVSVVAALAAVTISACDTGDGTTLQDPIAPTSTAPVDTTPLPSIPLGDPATELSSPDDPGLVGESPIGDVGIEPFQVITPWIDGDQLDPRFTCEGSGVAPDVAWSGVPEGTVELALSLVDESNLTNGRPFVQWVVAGIDPAVGELVQNDLPPGAFEAINFSGDIGYGAPCPDPGSTGVYVLRLFAVGQQVESGLEVPAADVIDMVETLSIDIATVSATVTR